MTLRRVTAPFHQRIDELCEAAHKDPSTLGLAAGLSKGTVGGWRTKSLNDNGRVNGNVEQLVKLAVHFKVSLDWLVGRTEHGGPERPGAPSAELGPDTLSMARAAATAVSFELSLPMTTTWQAAYNLKGQGDVDEFKKQLLALTRPQDESAAEANFSPAPDGTRYPVRRRAGQPK